MQSHPQVRVRDDGSPVYEYQPRLGRREFQPVDTGQLGYSLAYGSDMVQEGEGSGQLKNLTNPRWEVFYHSRYPSGTGEDIWQTFGSMPLSPFGTVLFPVTEFRTWGGITAITDFFNALGKTFA